MKIFYQTKYQVQQGQLLASFASHLEENNQGDYDVARKMYLETLAPGTVKNKLSTTPFTTWKCIIH